MRRTAALAGALVTALLSVVVSVIPAQASSGPAPLAANASAGQASLATARNLVLRAASAAVPAVTVKAGDTLSGLAQKYLGGAAQWPALWAENRAVVPDPDALVPGEHLMFPAVAGPVSAALTAKALHAIPQPKVILTSATRGAASYTTHYSAPAAGPVTESGGVYSYGALEQLWVSAGGPAWAEAHAAEIAECESSGRADAYNPSGASGLWQILGSVVPGNLFSPFTNALNAVSKFKASGDTFAQWVCQ